MTTTPPPIQLTIIGTIKAEPVVSAYTVGSQIADRDAQWMERITALEADRKMLREALKRARFDSLNMSIADQQFITAALENTHD